MKNEITLSADRRDMTIVSENARGRSVITAHWDHPATPEEIDATMAYHAADFLVPGETLKARKLFGHLWVALDVGPPTWWLPRFNLLPKGFGFGWLNAAVEVWW